MSPRPSLVPRSANPVDASKGGRDDTDAKSVSRRCLRKNDDERRRTTTNTHPSVVQQKEKKRWRKRRRSFHLLLFFLCFEKKKKLPKRPKRRRRTPFVCQHQHQHTIKHTRRTNTHKRLLNTITRKGSHSPPCWFAILAWRWCRILLSRFLRPSFLSLSPVARGTRPCRLRRLRRRLQSVFNCFPKTDFEIGVRVRSPINTPSEASGVSHRATQ